MTLPSSPDRLLDHVFTHQPKADGAMCDTISEVLGVSADKILLTLEQSERALSNGAPAIWLHENPSVSAKLLAPLRQTTHNFEGYFLELYPQLSQLASKKLFSSAGGFLHATELAPRWMTKALGTNVSASSNIKLEPGAALSGLKDASWAAYWHSAQGQFDALESAPKKQTHLKYLLSVGLAQMGSQSYQAILSSSWMRTLLELVRTQSFTEGSPAYLGAKSAQGHVSELRLNTGAQRRSAVSKRGQQLVYKIEQLIHESHSSYMRGRTSSNKFEEGDFLPVAFGLLHHIASSAASCPGLWEQMQKTAPHEHNKDLPIDLVEKLHNRHELAKQTLIDLYLTLGNINEPLTYAWCAQWIDNGAVSAAHKVVPFVMNRMCARRLTGHPIVGQSAHKNGKPAEDILDNGSAQLGYELSLSKSKLLELGNRAESSLYIQDEKNSPITQYKDTLTQHFCALWKLNNGTSYGTSNVLQKGLLQRAAFDPLVRALSTQNMHTVNFISKTYPILKDNILTVQLAKTQSVRLLNPIGLKAKGLKPMPEWMSSKWAQVPLPVFLRTLSGVSGPQMECQKYFHANAKAYEDLATGMQRIVNAQKSPVNVPFDSQSITPQSAQSTSESKNDPSQLPKRRWDKKEEHANLSAPDVDTKSTGPWVRALLPQSTIGRLQNAWTAGRPIQFSPILIYAPINTLAQKASGTFLMELAQSWSLNLSALIADSSLLGFPHALACQKSSKEWSVVESFCLHQAIEMKEINAISQIQEDANQVASTPIKKQRL